MISIQHNNNNNNNKRTRRQGFDNDRTQMLERSATEGLVGGVKGGGGRGGGVS